MLHQGKVKRGHLNWLSFYVALGLLLVILLNAHQVYGRDIIEEVIQILSVLAFYGFIALSLRFNSGQKQKRQREI
jgi:hypothetical protein